MKKISTYIPSLIAAVLLVFCFLGGSAAMIADVYLTEDKTSAFAEKEKLGDKSMAAIEKYYKERAASTGIPASVFVDNISSDYVSSVIEEYISATYKALDNGGKFNPEVPVNPQLESAIDKFFNDYADEIGYEKDEKFIKKLDATKKNAYKTVGDCCDIFKVDSMNSHGLLKKLSRLYSKRYKLTAFVFGSMAILITLLFIIHRKYKREVLYWCGVPVLLAGIIGLIPSAYLISAEYYDSFTIKQPQVFRAYTRAMYKLTESFAAVSTALIVTGVCLIVVYKFVTGRPEKSAVPDDPAKVQEKETD